jgi:hypothetical protein
MLNQPIGLNPYQNKEFKKFCEEECEDRFASEAPLNCICPYLEVFEQDES